MSTMTTTSHSTTTGRLRTGLALSAFLGLLNVPFLFAPIRRATTARRPRS